jgi:hypothetical protein
MASTNTTENLPTPRSQNLSNGAFEAAATSGTTSKGRVAFSTGTFKTEKENDVTQEISNPQDATLRKPANGDDPVVQNDSNKSNKQTPQSNTKIEKRTRRNRNPQSNKSKTSEFKKRKRGRLVRVATVEDANDASAKSNFPPLPGNQYRATLRRRAIRKLEEGAVIEDGADPAEYGDISLGMKLILAGGRVIVQTLKSLSDGRASPAQLAGVIQRGDVLLAIGHLSLVNLPVDKLMESLKPLSAPGPKGSYKRILDLRFEVGVGMELLKSHEDSQSWKNPGASPAFRRESEAVNDMFSLFPMVDQLSGAPLFDDHKLHNHSENEMEEHALGILKEDSEEDEDEDEASEDALQSEDTKEEESPDDLISTILARQQRIDRVRYTSEFFNWSEDLSELLRKTARIVEAVEEEKGAGMTQTERVELGKKVMKLAKSLAFNMEDIDKGKDMRCFKTWSTNFSLRSGASARRRYIFDTASLRSHQQHQDLDDDSVGSAGSGSLEDVDGDALLLGLAAHDGIWRNLVVEALKKSIDEMENQSDGEEEVEEEPEVAPDMDDALSKELGNFLFGKRMSLIITKKKKTFVLPPEEVTTVLFDLITNIATSAPDEITVFGQTSNNLSCQSGLGTQGKAKAALRADYILANLFVLEEALPVWLKSFRPFPLDQRRVLWPRIRHSSTASHAGSNTVMSDGDSLTVDSWGSATKSPARTKDIREIIEDQELDVETRAET